LPRQIYQPKPQYPIFFENFEQERKSTSATTDIMDNYLNFKKSDISETLDYYHRKYNLKYTEFRMRFMKWEKKVLKPQRLIHDHIIVMQNEYFKHNSSLLHANI
jgi:hypothetical protein